MRLVERMTMAPIACLGCGSGNVPDEHGEVGPFVDLEVDVNWGDSVYLCPRCVTKIASLMDFIDDQEAVSLQREIRRLRKAKYKAEAERDDKDARLRRIVAGRQESRRTKKELASK